MKNPLRAHMLEIFAPSRYQLDQGGDYVFTTPVGGKVVDLGVVCDEAALVGVIDEEVSGHSHNVVGFVLTSKRSACKTKRAFGIVVNRIHFSIPYTSPTGAETLIVLTKIRIQQMLVYQLQSTEHGKYHFNVVDSPGRVE